MPIKSSSFKQLCKDDMVKIELLHKQKWKTSNIAKELGFHRSSISRELKNTKNWDVLHENHKGLKKRYNADAAWQNHSNNKSVCGANCKAFVCKPLVLFVTQQLVKKKWSPKISIQHAKDNSMFQRYFTSRTV